ncbi:hypothetical protein [Flavobacterium hydatis]|uniref:Uncharacterized protein n=1 Tax=Flavobacterium hydatis TaxID=991 RepID=A0ABX4CGZ7_FLAHY|nr:hypothetical protein [Flavobacterium hydatis]OXA93889.1 hypothetical protein B0A62_12070 [Flavobacterium hydatis]
MKIAIIAWGSLIWNPETLKYDKEFGWSGSGPFLPVEFARISKNGRLTLVITENGTLVQTFYAISNYADLNSAVGNLKYREGTTSKNIGYFNKRSNTFYPTDFQYVENISQWVANLDVDAVIWTNLPENWQDVTDDRIRYLNKLTDEKKDSAKTYIAKTPKQIATRLKLEIVEKLQWL